MRYANVANRITREAKSIIFTDIKIFVMSCKRDISEAEIEAKVAQLNKFVKSNKRVIQENRNSYKIDIALYDLSQCNKFWNFVKTLEL